MDKSLRKNFIKAVIAVLIGLVAISTATFAWYVFNASAKTTDVHMAAGSTVSLSISNEYDGVYGLATSLTGFNDVLVPVSTDSILGGFQKVYGFTDGSDLQSKLAKLFKPATSSDYFMATLYIKSSAPDTDLYLQDIGYVDSDLENPLSTAARVGFVVHEQGENKPVKDEFIFEINDGTHPNAYYNTEKGEAGHVLDHTKTDGSTVPFTPYGKANYVGSYNSKLSKLELKPDSICLGTLTEADVPVQIDVYIWLEGCDIECTHAVQSNKIRDNYIESYTLSFAGDIH